MGKKNSYAAVLYEKRQTEREAIRKLFTQYLTDTACLALNDMGWGKDRIDTFLTKWGEEYDQFFDTLRNLPETDYLRVKFDERIKAICKPEYYEPFEQRYPYMPEVKY